MEYVIISGGVAQDFTDGVQVIDMDNINTDLPLDELFSIWEDLRSAPRDIRPYAEDVENVIKAHPDFGPDDEEMLT